MTVEETTIAGVKVLTPKRYGDERGFLSETYSVATMKAAGIDVPIVQENHSFSRTPGTVRGLHFQAPPHGQKKLIRVLRGAIFDVAVDIRVGSPTYGAWTSVELSDDRWNQLFLPAGFAHGFCTLTPDAHVLYKVSAGYAPESEGGLAWDDPELAITWPPMERYILSERDRAWPTLSTFESPFRASGDAPTKGGTP